MKTSFPIRRIVVYSLMGLCVLWALNSLVLGRIGDLMSRTTENATNTQTLIGLGLGALLGGVVSLLAGWLAGEHRGTQELGPLPLLSYHRGVKALRRQYLMPPLSSELPAPLAPPIQQQAADLPHTPVHAQAEEAAAQTPDRRHSSKRGYVQGNLTAGEKVVYEAKLHWIIFVPPAIVTLVIAAIFLFAAQQSLIIPALVILTFVWSASLYNWFGGEFAITSQRIIIKVGLIWRVTLEMNLAKIESVLVYQSILGRILGYGTVIVIGTGGTKQPFHGVSSPLEFRKAFQALHS